MIKITNLLESHLDRETIDKYKIKVVSGVDGHNVPWYSVQLTVYGLSLGWWDNQQLDDIILFDIAIRCKEIIKNVKEHKQKIIRI